MKNFDFGRYACSCGLVAVMLAGCGGLRQPFDSVQGDVNGAPPVTQSAVKTPTGSAYRVLYNFGSYATDGRIPEGSLINLKDTLYGTTLSGGSGCYASGGCGTVFAITTSGEETVLHNFSGSTDGALPYAGLVNVSGVLYGTTGGGASSGGTVFSITPSGTENVLHDFKGTPDGFDPQAALIGVGGTLYGTTAYGGSDGQGTVFSITVSGGETVLHNFGGMGTHGSYPEASLLQVNGRLFGTTYKGVPGERGTVFEITRSGNGHVAHVFIGTSKDGSFPRAGLIDVDGTLYGTTSGGGRGNCEGCGNHEHYGTIFAITPAGKERLLYKFQGYPKDGAVPDGELLYAGGIFYGTTESGGANCAISHGCGTIFSITRSGSEKVLYSFLPRDGAHPVSGLIDVNGRLYGTTPNGGTHDEGTVYSLSQ